MQRILAALVLCGVLIPTVALAQDGAYLGVILGTLDSDVMKKLDYDGRGAYVTDVVKDGPADKAGMKDRDIIITIDKDAIVGPGHLRDVLSYRRSGETVTVNVWRKGKKETLKVELGEKQTKVIIEPGDIAKTIVISGEPRAWLGVRTQELSQQLAEHFGTRNGVLVSEVLAESPAAGAGLVAGDVIIRVGKESVEHPFELTKVLGDQKPGEKVALTLIRDGKELTKEIELGETPKKYTKGMPQIFGWRSDGDESGSLNFDFLKGLPYSNFPLLEREDFESQLKDQQLQEELQNELKELRESLTEEMKALRAELDELKKNLKRTN